MGFQRNKRKPRFLFWWGLPPVRVASVIQGFLVNWRKAAWAVVEAAITVVLVLVFSIGLLDYAYHHERQTIERLLTSRTPSP